MPIQNGDNSQCPTIKQRPVKKMLVPVKNKQCEIYEECLICMKNHVFVKKKYIYIHSLVDQSFNE